MKRIVLAVAAFIVLAGSAQAATLASWDVYTLCSSGTNTSVAGTDSTYVDATDMTMGSGLSRYTYKGYFETKGWGGSDDGDYIELGFSVADGYAVTLDELLIGFRTYYTGPGTIGVYTSLDGFSEAVSTISMSGNTWTNKTIDLSDLGTITGDFTIRLYEIGNTQADGSGSTSNSTYFAVSEYYKSGNYYDVQFTGEVSSVPVPGAFLLMGSGLLALAGFRRKNA